MLTIGPAVARTCGRSEHPATYAYAPQNDTQVQILALVLERCVLLDRLSWFRDVATNKGEEAVVLRFRPFARLAATCRELRDVLDGSPAWSVCPPHVVYKNLARSQPM